MQIVENKIPTLTVQDLTGRVDEEGLPSHVKVLREFIDILYGVKNDNEVKPKDALAFIRKQEGTSREEGFYGTYKQKAPYIINDELYGREIEWALQTTFTWSLIKVNSAELKLRQSFKKDKTKLERELSAANERVMKYQTAMNNFGIELDFIKNKVEPTPLPKRIHEEGPPLL